MENSSREPPDVMTVYTSLTHSCWAFLHQHFLVCASGLAAGERDPSAVASAGLSGLVNTLASLPSALRISALTQTLALTGKSLFYDTGPGDRVPLKVFE